MLVESVTSHDIHFHERNKISYLPLNVGVRPKNIQIPTDVDKDIITIATAANASPSLDFTISIFSVK